MNSKSSDDSECVFDIVLMGGVKRLEGSTPGNNSCERE